MLDLLIVNFVLLRDCYSNSDKLYANKQNGEYSTTLTYTSKLLGSLNQIHGINQNS